MQAEFPFFLIELNALQFHAHHGLYEKEKINGNDFEVNVKLHVSTEGPITHLEETIDYSIIYSLIATRMQQPTELLETLVQDMVQLILNVDLRIKMVCVSITKLHPPIKKFIGNVCVSFSVSR